MHSVACRSVATAARLGPSPGRCPSGKSQNIGNPNDTLYAATESGLLVSKDAGGTWAAAVEGSPVSLVEVTPDGTLYAFVLGQGLLRSGEGELDLASVGADWGDRILLHLAVDPANKDRTFVASHQGNILASKDGGATWSEFGR